MYRDGLFVKKDAVNAARWYEIGAERGDTWAASERAELALQGRPTPTSQVVAAQFFALAASLDRNNANPSARQRLAGLPVRAKVDALAQLRLALGAPAAQSFSDESQLAQILVEVARAAWLKRNPRVDLF
jgi:TPR repeat protein